MKHAIKIIIFFFLIIFTMVWETMSSGGPPHSCCTIAVPGFSLLAQETDASTTITMPERERPAESSNVLYQVMAVILVIWLGLAMYLILIDRRVTRLEKSLPGKPGKDSL